MFTRFIIILNGLVYAVTRVPRINCYPFQIARHSSIDTRSIWLGTSVAKGHNSSQTENAIPDDQGTTAIALERLFIESGQM